MEPFRPEDLGMPPKFRHWRDGQLSLLEESLNQDKRFLIQAVPTGGGKSAGYIASAILYGGRTLILTSTKGLQDQLEREFGDLVVVIKGKSAYRCKINYHSVQNGPCNWGYQCRLKFSGCPYYDQIRKAYKARIVVTNYAFWMSNPPDILGEFDYLVGDEAHGIVDHLLGHQSIHLYKKECEKVAAWPRRRGGNLGFYKVWATVLKDHINREMARIKEAGNIESPQAMELLSLSIKLSRLDKVRDNNWVAEHLGDTIHFDPIWPEPSSVEKDLFRGIGKVLLTSATINRKVLEILQLDPRDYTFTEYGSFFPAGRRPIVYVPTVRMDHRLSNAGMGAWIATINNITRPRLHRKGLIHTVSYDRSNILFNTGEFKDFMIRHDRRSTRDAVKRFKEKDPPAILISPSMTMGWDFPYDECRWQVLGKVPFPDSRSQIAQARNKVDPEYDHFNTMQSIVQSCGRGMRAKDDYVETFIIDDHWDWFSRKYKKFIPMWFRQSMKMSRTIPLPLGGAE